MRTFQKLNDHVTVRRVKYTYDQSCNFIFRKKIDIPPLCPCMVAAIASRSTSKSEPVPPTCLIELTELLCSDSPDPKNI